MTRLLQRALRVKEAVERERRRKAQEEKQPKPMEEAELAHA